MKKTCYILISILLISSCKSIQKMVDRGEYDDAIYFAIDKLAGKKNKKIKYVKGLEKAFNKITDQDLSYIESLAANERPANWAKVHDILAKMQRRQAKLTSLTPLVSENGYVAHFDFMDYNKLLAEANLAASEYHYKVATALTVNAKSKEDHRDVFYELEKIDRFRLHYKNKEQLKTEALEKGKTHIVVNYLESHFGPIENISIQLDDLWTKYYVSKESSQDMDYQIDFEVVRLDLGVERERENNFIESKEVKDGYEYEYDKNGNVKKDTLGNDIKKDRFIRVESVITEIFREKTASGLAIVRTIDLAQKNSLNESSIITNVFFQSEACSHRGDGRALSGSIRNRLNQSLEPFPTDAAMLRDVRTRMEDDFQDYLRRLALI